MELSIVGRAEAVFEVTEGVDLALRKHYTSGAKNCERYTLTVKVEGPRNAPGEAVQGDAHAMLRHGLIEAIEAMSRLLDEDEAHIDAMHEMQSGEVPS
jgi:hypothetical protein